MSPRNKEKNQQILDKRREQILSVALKVFAKRGFAATKISDIASAAGLSQGLIYRYFKTKDDIFTELFKRATIITEIPEYAAQLDVDPLEKIKNIVNMIISMTFIDDGLYYWHIVNQAYISEAIPAEAKKISSQKKSSLSDSIIPIIIEGQKLGQIAQDDPLKLYTALYSILNGLAMQAMRSKNTPDYPVSLPDADIIMRIFKTSDNSEKAFIHRKVKRQLRQIKLNYNHLVYRFRETTGNDFKTINMTLSETTAKKEKIFRIESRRETGEAIVAMMRADDMQPLLIELRNPQIDTISRIEYRDNSVFFDLPERNIHKEVKLSDEYYDNYTMFYILQGFPFDSNEKIKITTVMDGAARTPLGPYGIEIQKVGRETISVPAGNFDCYKLELSPAGVGKFFGGIYKYYFWYPVDEPRFMVKYEDKLGKSWELVKFE